MDVLAAGIIAVLGIYIFVIIPVYYILYVIGSWKIYTKAGEAGWKSLIPFYNIYILYKISWKTMMFWIWLILSVVSPFIDPNASGLMLALGWIVLIGLIVLHVMQSRKLAQSFEKGIGFTVGLIFLNPIFIMILGFGSARYIGPQE